MAYQPATRRHLPLRVYAELVEVGEVAEGRRGALIMDGFVKIPRALFESEAWRNASEGQKIFILELYARVAFARHEQKLKKGTVMVEVGQVAVSLRDFANELGMPVRSLRDMIAYFVKNGIIDTSAQKMQCADAHFKMKYTLLTVKDIDCAKKGDLRTAKEEKCRTYTEEGLNREKTTPYNPPKFDSDDGILSYDQKRDVIKQHVLTSEVMWIENFCMKKHISKEQFEVLFDEFIQHRIDQGQVDENYEKVKIHFANWYNNKQDIKQHAANWTNTERPTREQRMEGYRAAMLAVLNGECTPKGYADEVLGYAQPF